MFLRIDARGTGSDQISYQIGNHPGRQLIRRESEVLGRLWFPEYDEEQSSVVLHVRSNIPPIPGRLTSSSIRYREWNRFAEWMQTFLGKVIRDPAPPSDEQELEYRVHLGVLPRSRAHGDTLVDLFERADLHVQPPPGRQTELQRWLRVTSADLSFPQLLRRLALLVPPLFGGMQSEFHADGYAKLLDSFRGTWFNVHPLKDFLTNRFLCLTESVTPSGDREEHPASLQQEREQFKARRAYARNVGNQIQELVRRPRDAAERSFWILNARDGFLVPPLSEYVEAFSTHLVEGRNDELRRCEERIDHLDRLGDLSPDADPDVQWGPAGFRQVSRDADLVLWLPRTCELQDGLPSSMSNLLLSSIGPDRLVVWNHVENGQVLEPGLAASGGEPADLFPTKRDWTEHWSTRADGEGYDAHWHDVTVPSNLDHAPENSLLGVFRK